MLTRTLETNSATFGVNRNLQRDFTSGSQKRPYCHQEVGSVAAPYCALDVARYFLLKADPEEGELISNLKLQKLLYYAQGFHLALYDSPLFTETVEAWMHGPVVPAVYHAYKEYGAESIPTPFDFEPVKVFSEETIEFLDEVYDVYGQFSAWKLREMTHREPPWAETPDGMEISPDAMRTYFKTQLRN